jgi:hypothetical protein
LASSGIFLKDVKIGLDFSYAFDDYFDSLLVNRGGVGVWYEEKLFSEMNCLQTGTSICYFKNIFKSLIFEI